MVQYERYGPYERLIHLQIFDYIETTALLDPYQTGYRERHSTQDTLLKLTDDIRYGMDRKHVTLLLLILVRLSIRNAMSLYLKSWRN